MSGDGIGGKEEQERVPIVTMAVKRERDSPVLDVVPSKNGESGGELDPWTTPSKSSPKALDCWTNLVMAPVKPERSHLSVATKAEQCAADSLPMPKRSLKCPKSPLRCCPKFDTLSHSEGEAYPMEWKENNGKIMKSTSADGDGEQSLESRLKRSWNSGKMKDQGDDDLAISKMTLDFSGEELADDLKDKDDDTCITGSKYGVINTRCPLSGKLVTELENLVQSVNCHHVYDQAIVKAYINLSSGIPKCAVAGCSKALIHSDLVCDTSLTESIRDLRQKDTSSKLEQMMKCIHIDDE